MWFSISEQFAVIGYSVIMGIFFGIVYDFVKITRVLQGISAYSDISRKMHKRRLPLIGKHFFDSKKKTSSAAALVILFLGDILYSLFCAAAYSLFLFHAIRGQVRWYFIIATAVGFFLYYFTVSRLVIRLIEALFWGVRIILAYLWEMLLFPLRLIRELCSKTARFVINKAVAPIIHNVRYRRCTRYTEKIRQSLKAQIVFDKEV